MAEQRIATPTALSSFSVSLGVTPRDKQERDSKPFKKTKIDGQSKN